MVSTWFNMVNALFYVKTSILIKFCTFVFISVAISKGLKWVRRSNIFHINCQSNHGLSDSSVKTGNFLTGGSQEQKISCTFLGPKVKNAISDGTCSHLHSFQTLSILEKLE